MAFNLATYNPHPTPMHRIDARCKIVLMIVYSVVLFLVDTWTGIGALTLLFALAAYAARLNIIRAFRQLIPVVVILVLTLVFHSFTLQALDPNLVLVGSGPAGIMGNTRPIVLLGNFGFWPAGFVQGCFYSLRIVLLVGASLVLTTTTTSTQLTQALESFLKPFNRLGLPTHDIATIISIALRFIPVTIDEFQRIRAAQESRGARFDTGPLFKRLRTWTTVMVPWFVRMYLRADDLAYALDARCYGAAQATSLYQQTMQARSIALLVGGLIACVAIAFAF